MSKEQIQNDPNIAWEDEIVEIKKRLDSGEIVTSEEMEKLEWDKTMKLSGLSNTIIDGYINSNPTTKVLAIEVPIDEEYSKYVVGIVKTPSDPILNEYLRKSERVPIDAARRLLSTIWLGGYEGIKKERTLMLSFMEVLSTKLAGGQGRLKKLSRSTHS